MWNFSVWKSISIVCATWPYLIMRAVVMVVFITVVCVLVASGGIIAGEIGPALLPDDFVLRTAIAVDDVTMHEAQQSFLMPIGMAGGFFLALGVLYILREYTLYLIKAGHVAVMARMLDKRTVPSGIGQLGCGATAVRETFWETSTLFVFDQLIKAVLSSLETIFKRITMFVPFLAPLLALGQSVVTIAVTYIDEMILAHIMRTRPADPWRAGADALVLYAQNGKAMMINAFWLLLILIVFDGAVFAGVYYLAPIPEIALFGDDATMVVRVLAGIVTVMAVSFIVSEPFAVCTMLQAFDCVADGQSPDRAMEAKIVEHSDAFRELRNRGPQPLPPGWQPAR